ncbi:hypothetical protein HMPREF1394_00115, partial [Helicobacter pylori GAM105Ai]
IFGISAWVVLKICCFRDRQKAKNLKKTDASFWGLGVFLVVVLVIAYFTTHTKPHAKNTKNTKAKIFF